MRSRLLVVDDERLIRWSLEQMLGQGGYDVSSVGTAEAAVAAVRDDAPDLVLLDLKLPDGDGLGVLREIKELHRPTQVLIMTAYADVGTAVEAMKLGAYDYLPKPIDFENLAVTVRNALEASQLRRKVRLLSEPQRHRFRFEHIAGTSQAIREVIGLARKVAHSEATTVLLQGESGTGKDLLAKAMHYESGRAEEPFMEIACTAMPETLLESELFGYERGAFTDAKAQKKGLLEVAQGGSVFLDEIGDMSGTLQAKLLRVLEERRFRRLGGTRDIGVDVRVIAATNRDLRTAVDAATFRKDLYYRLQVVTITLPALRHRREDIALLARHFLERFSREFKKPLPRISPEADRLLLQYGWPGNVRELRNVIERIMILEDTDEVLPTHLPAEIGTPGARPGTPLFQLPATGVVMEEVERDLVRQALEVTQGNQTRSARLLGLTRDELRYRVKKFGLGHAEEAG